MLHDPYKEQYNNSSLIVTSSGTVIANTSNNVKLNPPEPIKYSFTSTCDDTNYSIIELEDVTVHKGDDFEEEYLSIVKRDEYLVIILNALGIGSDYIDVTVDDGLLKVSIDGQEDGVFIFDRLTLPTYDVKFSFADKYNLDDISVDLKQGLLGITVNRFKERYIKRFEINEE